MSSTDQKCKNSGIRITKHLRLIGWLFLVAFPGVLVVDVLMGFAYRTSTEANVIITPPRSGRTHRAIIVFPGFIMPGAPLAKAFAPYVSDDDALVVVNYAERGVDVPQICDKIMVALHTLQPSELRIYGGSMGGMLGKLFLDRYRQAGTPYGKVAFILDTAPSSRNNVKRPTVLLNVSCWYRGGPLSSAMWAAVIEIQAKPPAEADASRDTVRAARHAGAWFGMPAATSQACFVAKFPPLRAGELLDVAQQVIYLEGTPPGEDPLIRIPDAIAGWRVAFPNLKVITVQCRSKRWHLPLVEYPRATLRAVISPGS